VVWSKPLVTSETFAGTVAWIMALERPQFGEVIRLTLEVGSWLCGFRLQAVASAFRRKREPHALIFRLKPEATRLHDLTHPHLEG
jgi:hypothetical protein